mgnify:CR=1 FL=1
MRAEGLDRLRVRRGHLGVHLFAPIGEQLLHLLGRLRPGGGQVAFFAGVPRQVVLLDAPVLEGLSINLLVQAKKLAAQIGGVAQAKAAIDALAKLGM